jgi:hypothetical protein
VVRNRIPLATASEGHSPTMSVSHLAGSVIVHTTAKAQIIAGTKRIEYRQIKPHWTRRFAKVSVPFELRLLNGMNPPVPEVTVLIHRITKDRRAGEYRLHIKKVLGYRHWDRRRRRPKS